MATKKKTKEPSQGEMNNNLRKAKALEKIVEHNRDFLKLDITLPLGNPALKQVHTNQWLWTALPTDSFNLENWQIIAKALNSNVNRYEGYVRNRWYIESNDITVDVAGNKAEMKLGVNAFASTFNSYSEAYRGMAKAFTEATTQNTTSSSASKSTSNALAANTGDLINTAWVKQYNISSKIVDKVKSICKQGATDYANVRAIFKWSDDNLPYEGYSGTKYGAVGTMEHGAGNCCDHAHLFAAMCRCLGVKCNYIHNPCCGDGGHVYNIVYLDGKGIIVDTGRDDASWGSHWGNSGCPTEKTSIDF